MIRSLLSLATALAVASVPFASLEAQQEPTSSSYPVVGFVPDIDRSFSCIASGGSCDIRCFDGPDTWSQVTGWSRLDMKSIGAGFVLLTGYKDDAKTEQVNGGPIMVRSALYCDITKPAELD